MYLGGKSLDTAYSFLFISLVMAGMLLLNNLFVQQKVSTTSFCFSLVYSLILVRENM